MISRGRTGYSAIYSVEIAQDAVLILAIRHHVNQDTGFRKRRSAGH